MRYECCPKCFGNSFFLVKGEDGNIKGYECAACRAILDANFTNQEHRYIVVRLGKHPYGGPTVYHKSREAAEKEAIRLAMKENATFLVAQVVTSWKVQVKQVDCPLRPAVYFCCE